METAVKRFARNILLLHLLLLLLVLALVLLASRAIRDSAREQAQVQAERRQQMVAGQTARGIEAFYHSIVNDMDLVPRSEDDHPAREQLAGMLAEVMRDVPIIGRVRPLFGPPMEPPPGEGPPADGRPSDGAPGDRPLHERFIRDGLPPGGPNRESTPADAARPQAAQNAASNRATPPSERQNEPKSADAGKKLGGSAAGDRWTGERRWGGERTTGDRDPGDRSPADRGPNDRPGPDQPAGDRGNNRGGLPNWQGRPGGGRPPAAARSQMLGYMLGRQLEERVDHLFYVNVPSKPTDPLTIRDATVRASDEQTPSAEALVERFQSWLRNVKAQSISPFEIFDGRGYNLVAMPINNGRALLVAAVRVSTIAEQYLATFVGDESLNVLLVNDALTVVASSRPHLVGVHIPSAGDPDLARSLEASKAEDFQFGHVVEHSFMVGTEEFDPSLLTAQPLDVAGRKWFIVVGSPLKDVDALVATMFGKIVVWAIFVVVAVTGLFVSTSIQMIRSRARLERVKTDALHKELDRARQIQQAWLPRETPDCPTVDVAAVNFPANHISGDFYNWFNLADGRVAVVIGDVTGHGMSAAFLMATTQLLVRTTLNRITDPAACMEEVNRQLCTLIFNGQFVTLQIIVLDPDGGPARIASAGHPAPLLVRGDDLVPLPVDSQLVLGVDRHATYESTEFAVPSSGSLLMYTDGASDVLSPAGTRLGLDGLRKALAGRAAAQSGNGDGRHTAAADAELLLDAVVGYVNHFRGSHELVDDLTLVSIHVTNTTTPARRQLVGVG